MGMNDTETVALIAGGHTFGKARGAASSSTYVGPEPAGASIELMGIGWVNTFGTGTGKNVFTSGLEGAWTANPTKWDAGYFHLLYKYDWTQTKSAGGAIQWIPAPESIMAHGGYEAVANVPDAHVVGKYHLPIMFTTDLALRYDPNYGPISKRFHANFDEFTTAFKESWYKLCHRDMGPLSRHLGPNLPPKPYIWQDPIPSAMYDTVSAHDVERLKICIFDAINITQEITISDLVKAAWASASTYRVTDHRGGANGGRVRLAPQNNLDVNDPTSLSKVITLLEKVAHSFNHEQKTKNNNSKVVQVSFADLIILAGNVAIEEAARKAGHAVTVPFVSGRTDADQSITDIHSFDVLKPMMDGFRNYEGGGLVVNDGRHRPEMSLIDRAHLLTLTIPEMVVLVGGLRVLNANADPTSLCGVLTESPETLTNDFFVHLLDENMTWSPQSSSVDDDDGKYYYHGSNPKTLGKVWTASRVDLVLGSNSQLRAICEGYGSADCCQYFLIDFVKAWNKVMMLDRFDLLPVATRSSTGLVSKL
jgi:catalase-peroxidase